MSRPVLYVPGRGQIEGPDRPTDHAALEWAEGYARPGPALPTGTTLRIGHNLWALTVARRFRPLGRARD